MRDTKMLKAVCKRTGAHFGIEIKKIGRDWRAVDFIRITDTEATLMESAVRQPKFISNDNLQPCRVCGARTVGGCSHSQGSYRCSRDGEYNFQCLYCKELEVDYTPARLVDGMRSGDVITLSQGQVVKITAKSGAPLKGIEVGVGWDPVVRGDNLDIDSTVFVAGHGSDMETVYFGELKHPSGCVIHHGDNLTGVDIPNKDDENISVRLDKVPRDRHRIIFVLNIYSSSSRHQTLKDAKNMYIRLYDSVTHQPLMIYKVDQNMQGCTAIVIGMAFRDGQGWQFKAIGKGSHATCISDLERECASIN